MISELSLIEVLCRISLAPALVAFLLGTPACAAALAHAWRGENERARSSGWLGLKVGGVAGIWMAAVTAGLGFVVPWLFLLPAAMSAIALAHAHYYENSPQLSRYQFTIPTILYATLAVAVVAAVVRIWTADYADYSMRDEFAANLGRMKSISNVKLQGHTYYRYDQEAFEVSTIDFSLAGRPDTLIRLHADKRLRTDDSDEPLSTVVIYRIDRWEFHGTLRNPDSSKSRITGLNVGEHGPFENYFPFRFRTLDDIVDHYDELAKLAKEWPREDQPGEFTYQHGDVQYWAIDVGTRP